MQSRQIYLAVYKDESWNENGEYWYDYNDMLICPWCKRGEDRNFQIADYVDKPMLWCDSCGARSVLDLDLEFSKEDVIRVDEVPPEFDISPRDTADYGFYLTNLLWIEKVMPRGLDSYKPTRKLNKDDIIRFIECSYDDKIAQELGLENESCEDEDDIALRTINLGIKCQSFDVTRPRFPYPLMFDLSHDGGNICVQCIDKNKEVITVCYSGD